MNEENEEKKDAVICSHCGRVIDVDGGETFIETHDGEIICEECADACFFRCEKCDKYYPLGEGTDVCGDTLCDECRDEYSVKCYSCGDWIYVRDAVSYGDEYLCEHCYDNYYFTCDRCGEVYPDDDGHWHGDSHYCDDCHRSMMDGVSGYHDWGGEYFPHKFKGEKDGLMIGVELECDDGEFDKYPVRGWVHDDIVHFESDGSLSDSGVELITQPCSLRYHKETVGWKTLCKTMVDMGFRSHDTDTCGLHVHLTRNVIPITSIVKMDIWLNRWMLWRDVARRDSIYSGEYDDNKKVDIGHAVRNSYRCNPICEKWYGRGYNDRYQPLNTNNSETIEIRIFKGSLNHETVLGTIEMCHALVKFADTVPVTDVYDTTPERFLSFIASRLEDYPDVFPMLRRLIKPRESDAVKSVVESVNSKIDANNEANNKEVA